MIWGVKPLFLGWHPHCTSPMTRCRTGFCCWNRWTVASFTLESACFTASATKTCAHVIGKNVHVIRLGMSCDTWAVGQCRYLHHMVLLWISTFLFATWTPLEKCCKLPVQFELHIIQYSSCYHFPAVFRTPRNALSWWPQFVATMARRGWEWRMWLS